MPRLQQNDHGSKGASREVTTSANQSDELTTSRILASLKSRHFNVRGILLQAVEQESRRAGLQIRQDTIAKLAAFFLYLFGEIERSHYPKYHNRPNEVAKTREQLASYGEDGGGFGPNTQRTIRPIARKIGWLIKDREEQLAWDGKKKMLHFRIDARAVWDACLLVIEAQARKDELEYQKLYRKLTKQEREAREQHFKLRYLRAPQKPGDLNAAMLRLVEPSEYSETGSPTSEQADQKFLEGSLNTEESSKVSEMDQQPQPDESTSSACRISTVDGVDSTPSHIKETLTTSLTTSLANTHAKTGARNLGDFAATVTGVCVDKSKFSFEEREEYRLSQSNLGKGWLVASADGRFDRFIEEYLARKAAGLPEPCNRSGRETASQRNSGLLAERSEPLAEKYSNQGQTWDESSRDELWLARKEAAKDLVSQAIAAICSIRLAAASSETLEAIARATREVREFYKARNHSDKTIERILLIVGEWGDVSGRTLAPSDLPGVIPEANEWLKQERARAKAEVAEAEAQSQGDQETRQNPTACEPATLAVRADDRALKMTSADAISVSPVALCRSLKREISARPRLRA